MQLPQEFLPVASESFTLDDDRVVLVPKARPTFKTWHGPTLENTFGGKPVLEYLGEASFAELVILRIFLAAGWSGRWIETYGAPRTHPRLLTEWATTGLTSQVHEPISEPSIQAVLKAIARSNGDTYSGCWDVVAWQGSRLVFAEAKRKGHDSLNKNQRRWLSAAIKAGVSPDSFLVVEWAAT